MTRSRRLAAAASLALAACAGEVGDGAPRVASVAPPSGYQWAETAIAIRGEGFRVEPYQTAEGEPAVDATFRVWLGATELPQVEWVSEGELRARVPPDLPPGPHRLELRDPRGREAALAAAYSVVAGAPAALVATASVLPSVASLGQPVTIRVEVTNEGDVPALAVAPTLEVAGDALALAPAAPAPLDVAPGETRVFLLAGTAAARGTAGVLAGAAGTDEVTGAPVAAPAVSAGPLLVQPPSLLSASARATPGRASLGQLVIVDVEYANAPDVAAVAGLAPALSAASGPGGLEVVAAPPPCDVPGGGACTATFVLRATRAGDVELLVDAAGADANSGAPVAAPRAGVALALDRGPALSAVAAASPVRASVGQPLQLSLVVTNAGDVDALGVVASVLAAPIAAEAGAAPPPQDVPAGATRTFTRAFLARQPGTGAFVAAATGQDANGAGAVSTGGAQSNEVVVDAPASLVATAAASPLRVTAGQPLEVTLDVTNLGEAAADATPVLGGAASGTATFGAPPLAAARIAGGETVRFAWTVSTSGSGVLQLAPRVDAVDVNSGALSSAGAAAGPVTVQAPAALRVEVSAAPALANEGQPLAVRVDVANAGEAAAAAVIPSLTASGASFVAGPLPVPPVRIAGGATARFEWTFAAGAAPGEARFSASAAGGDENDGAPLAGGPVEAPPVVVQRAAALSVEIVAAPARVNVGQTFPVRVGVRNDGDSAAAAVVPEVGCDGCVAGPAPAPPTLAGGASVELERQITAAVLGPATLGATASGTDAVDGLVRTSGEATAPLVVERAARLVAVSSVDGLQVSAGQPLAVTLRVTNAGDAAAEVTPSLSAAATGSAAHEVTAAPNPARVAGGASATFRWTVALSGSGTVVLEPRVDGTDENDGAAVSAADATEAVRVQAPAQLAAALEGPAAVNGGQTFTVAVVVSNAGEAAATGVSAAVTPAGPVAWVSGPLPPPPLRLEGGATRRFEWTYAAGAPPASVAFDATATATDENAGTPLAATAPRRSLPVQRAAALALEVLSAPARVNEGQRFPVRVRVQNDGDAAALGVEAAIGCDGCAADAPPGPVDLAGGASAELERTLVAGVPAAAAVRASATGADGTDGVVRSAPEVARPLSVERPAALAAAFRVAPVAPMIGFPVELVVTNPVLDPADAQADALGVLPGALVVLEEPGFLSAAEVSCSPLAAPPAALLAGAAVSFRWTCSAARVGEVRLSASASGADGNDAAPLVASAAATVALDEAAEIVSDPFGDGTAFSFVFAYGGHVFLGPSGDGRGVVRCAPDGSGCASFAFSFAYDDTDWVWSSPTFVRTGVSRNVPPIGCATPVTTLGAVGFCNAETPTSTPCACGPDFESGRGLFTSVRLGAAQDEWLVAMGRTKKMGELNYAYMTRGTTAPLAFSYVDLYAAMPPAANVENVVSTAVLNDRIYFGLQVETTGDQKVESTDGPRVAVLTRPPDPPGLDATSADAFAMTFQGTAMDDNGTAVVISQMDAMLGFEGRLFVANRKAVLVSRTGTPPATDGGTGFDDCTPQDPAAWAASGIAQYPSKRDVTPADKGVAALVPWAGRLYLARNTAADVPELWVFTPRHDPQGGAFLGCAADRSDWRRVATQLGAATSTHATALFASDAFLYYGLDDAAAGVRLFRTAVAPAGDADFRGRLGCTAPCEPLGRAGLGDAANTRFFDARALAFDGEDQVWATVGDGIGAVRVYRIAD